MLSTLLWHLIMFKTVENNRYFLTSLVAGHTKSFESFLVIFTIWRSVFAAVFDIWDHTLLLTNVWGAKHHVECKLLETRTRCSNGSSRRQNRCDGAVLFFVQWWLVWLSGLVAFAPSSTATNEMDQCFLALARKALRMDTCAQNRPDRYGNSSSWSQQMWLWQCSGCYGGNKLLVIPHPRGRFCLPFFVASLVCLTLWTTAELPHPLHIRGCDCWCLICRDSTTCSSSMIWTTQWLVQRNSSLILWSRKRSSTQMFMRWWPSGRLNASRLQMCHLTNKVSHHQLLSVKSSCPSSVNKFYRTGLCALRPSDQDCLGCAPNPLQETCTRSQTLRGICLSMW